MQWIEKQRARPVNATAFAKLLDGVSAQARQRPEWHIDRGRMHLRDGDHQAALDAFETAERLAPRRFSQIADIAAAYIRLGRNQQALTICENARAATPDVLRERARALQRLGRGDEACAVLLSALSQEGAEDALGTLLKILAASGDGKRLLDVCDGLAPRYARTAIARAYRAIGLSHAGRTDEAVTLMDMERYVSRIAFAPSAAQGASADFNRALAEEILADQSPFSPRRDDLELNWSPDIQASPRLVALYDFIRVEMQRYLDEFPRRGLASVMPPRPQTAQFEAFNVVLRNDGSNGEHVHALSYVSAVYHVLVPDSVTQASDDRGALALGCCSTLTGGYQPCWGVRYIKPVAGWLTLFPAHIFHDVVPSRTSSPRVSVAADLKPIWDK